MINEHTSLRELAFIVGNEFIRQGAKAVLSGGGAATIYSKDAYQSQDLDFVLTYTGGLAHVIESLGFRAEGGMYRREDIVWTIEFIQGDLAIGEDYEIEPVRLEENGRMLDILSPTDCVRDRLAWYLNYNPADFGALSQALLVAKAESEAIDFNIIRNWATTQTYPDRLKLFLNGVGQPI